jgi:hypothetical protein
MDLKEDKLICPECLNWVKKVLKTLSHLLGDLWDGFRLYDNKKEWNCFFCNKLIEFEEGYWARQAMHWSQGNKLCWLCFIKFIDFMKGAHLLSYLETEAGPRYTEDYIDRVLIPWLGYGGSIWEYERIYREENASEDRIHRLN